MNFRLNFQSNRRLTWSPKRVDSANQKRLPANARAQCDVFHARLSWQGMVKLNKSSIFVIDHRGTICHPKSSYVTTELYGTSTADATIMRSFQTEQFSRFLLSSYADHVNLAAAKRWRWTCVVVYFSEMAALLNSLSFAFTNSFLQA